MTIFGDKIRELRKEKKITQQMLGARNTGNNKLSMIMASGSRG